MGKISSRSITTVDSDDIMNMEKDMFINGYSDISQTLTIPDPLVVRIQLRFLDYDFSFIKELKEFVWKPFQFEITLSRDTERDRADVINKIMKTMHSKFGPTWLTWDVHSWLFWKFNLDVRSEISSSTDTRKVMRSSSRIDWIPTPLEELSKEWPFIPIAFREKKDWRRWIPGGSCMKPSYIAETMLSFTLDPPSIDTLVCLMPPQKYASELESLCGIRKWSRKWHNSTLETYTTYRSQQLSKRRTTGVFQSDGTFLERRPPELERKQRRYTRDVEGLFAIYQEGPGDRSHGLTLLEDRKKWRRSFVKRENRGSIYSNSNTSTSENDSMAEKWFRDSRVF